MKDATFWTRLSITKCGPADTIRSAVQSHFSPYLFMQKSRSKKPKRIVARSIVLEDTEGEPRIIMDADDGKGGAYICLHARDGKSIQISAPPEGAISIAVLGKECRSGITIGISEDERGGIEISDSNGKLGIILGEELGTSTHRLLLFKNGRHFLANAQRQEAEAITSPEPLMVLVRF